MTTKTKHIDDIIQRTVKKSGKLTDFNQKIKIKERKKAIVGNQNP